MRKLLLFASLCMVLLCFSQLSAKGAEVHKLTESYVQDPLEVTGLVTDSVGTPLLGVTVRLNNAVATSTDQNGRYVLVIPQNAVEGAVLTFSLIGYDPHQIPVEGRRRIDVQMIHGAIAIEETVVTALGQRVQRDAVVGAVTSVNPTELKVPSSNLTTALSGRASGIIGFQRSGEPGADNAEFFIRGVTTFGYKVNPLILIDNVESTATDLARLQVDDIENFSILKDASSAAVYGARGANGVILITTKQGKMESMSIAVRLENSLSAPTREVELVDPITYMNMANEAVLGRDPLANSPYSQRQIEMTQLHGGSLAYPAVDWMDELLNKNAMNQRANVSVRGGGAIAQYYVSGSFNQDNGILKVPAVSNFNNNVNLQSYNLRSNVNINLAEGTKLDVRLSGTFDDYNGPLYGGTKAYRDIMRAVPTRFQPYFPAGENYKYLNHIMFGNAETGDYLNPYAEMVRGYREYSQSRMQAQLELNQDLSFITEGLNFTARTTTTRYAFFSINRQYNPFFYSYQGVDDLGNNLYNIYNEDTGTEYLNYSEGSKDVTSRLETQAILNYNRNFGVHGVTGTLVGMMVNQLAGNAGSLQLSLPHRNLNLAGKFTYAYDRKYIVEANFGYNGSERFSTDHRFGFFPSIGVAWHASRENFLQPLQPVLSNLRFRATYGLVGNDEIGSASQRFYYLSEVDMNSTLRQWTFGPGLDETLTGVNVSRYPNAGITWETAYKSNVAIEVGMFNNALELQADWFTERRTNIFMARADVPATMGLSAPIYANIGEASAEGFDMSLKYNKGFYNGLWVGGMLNFTYATSKYDVYEEPHYEYPWLYRAGFPINIARGYIAERLFIDDLEVANSPEQQLGGDVIAGDIKYIDVNGDGKITSLDRVPIGHPTVPEINYGFGLSMGYKGFDMSVFFQGLGRTSLFINPSATGPFRTFHYNSEINGTEPIAGFMQNNVLQVYADSYWSEENRDLYATFPRLSWVSGNPNNEVTSTWWMRDGSFLRLKQVELGYSFDHERGLLDRFGVAGLRVYTNGLNLLTFSKFKMWDVEMGGNGLNYPIQRVFNLGLTVDF